MNHKKIFSGILAFTISTGLFNNFAFAAQQSSQQIIQQSEKQDKSLSVKGSAVVNVKPDIAILDLGVKTTGKDITKIQSENNKIMDKIVDAVIKLGVDKKDIYTSGYYLYPSYNYNSENSSEISGYELSNTISLKVRDITKVGEIVTETTKAGANINNGIQFTVNDYDKYYKEALENAIENGNNKAKVIAEGLKVDLGPAIKVEEDQNYNNYNANSNFPNVKSEEKSTGIRANDVLITASVNMIFSY